MALFVGNEISDFWLNQSVPGHITEVPDPTGAARSVFKFDVLSTDRLGGGPPRAQLVSPALWTPGEALWARSAFYLPPDFPTTGIDWFNVYQGPYGEPYKGSPPVAIQLDSDPLRVSWQRNITYDWDIPFSQPVTRGRWHRYMWHVRFASEAQSGFAELWIDGQQITFFDPASPYGRNPTDHPACTRLHMSTRDESNSGANNHSYLQTYYAAETLDEAVVYHAPLIIGKTRAGIGA